MTVLGQVEQDRFHPPVGLGLLREAELGEQRADVLLDRPLRQAQRGADGGVVLALGDLGEDLALAGVRWERGEVRARLRALTSTSTTFGSMTEPPRATSRIASASWSGSEIRSFSR